VGIDGRFAYESFRPGQKELAQRVYEACMHGEVLLAEAMSGFGKTGAVLAGALSAAEETGCKVVYTCRTKRQIHRVIEEISRIQKKHSFKAASVLSKFDYCLLKRTRSVPRESFGWFCSFNTSNNLCSYFLNVTLAGADFDQAVNHAVYAAPSHAELMRESELIHVCPYEVARLAMAQAQVAVAPYQYIFDPKAAPVLFDRNQLDRSKVFLVVDEAHNLRDFMRGLNSATLTLGQVEGAVREADALYMDDAARSLRTLGRTLERAMGEHAGWHLDRASLLDRFRREQGAVWLQNLALELSACSGAAWGSIESERRLPSLILKVGEFFARLSSASRAVLVKWEGNLGLIDPDPVGGLACYLQEFRSSVMISATINPSSVFRRSLGLASANAAVYEASVEPLVTVRTVVDTGVSTRYKLRSPQMFLKIAERVASVVNATETGTGVFVPSYSILAALSAMVAEKVGDRRVVAEMPGLSSQDAADLFDSFTSSSGAVLFGVQGGRFSEGENFSGELMGAVVVVGLSLPPPSPMLYAEYECLKRAGEPDSYLMLSRLPALRKAFQAAGRHVRSPGKRALVFLLDERFRSPHVIDLMPSWLKKDLLVGDFSPEGLGSLTRQFWSFRG
jgi:DNA excision repair protein ERCC-2